MAQNDGDLTAQEVGQLMRNAFAMSWTTGARKQAYLAALDDYLATSAGGASPLPSSPAGRKRLASRRSGRWAVSLAPA